MENMCPGFQGGGESMYVRACARTYICLALQKCQCVRSIFKGVGQLWRVLWNVLLSVLLHFRSVAIVAKWWCQSRSIGIKATPPLFSTEITVCARWKILCSQPGTNMHHRRQNRLWLHTQKCAQTEHTCIHWLVVWVDDNRTDVCEERTEYLLTKSWSFKMSNRQWWC